MFISESDTISAITQRKILVRNANGTTYVISQNVVTPSKLVKQKLGITRGLDGKITSITGLQPGQQLGKIFS